MLIVVAEAHQLDQAPVAGMVGGVEQPLLPVLGILPKGEDHVVDRLVEGEAVGGERQPGNEDRPAAVLGYDLRARRADRGQEVAQTVTVDKGRRPSVAPDRGDRPSLAGLGRSPTLVRQLQPLVEPQPSQT
ncbi:hypothetical protein Psuf_051280 [Phytohabitans suffuscus]|uniref:Uncharacterized protein n=1 Tax=Phytohabitans suffuscus TaxID=624315 RepID=A0A6F8YNR8_9ACTN|nr:hypothetical protein Psuf_051280 [Phytohabitans suffuscus]